MPDGLSIIEYNLNKISVKLFIMKKEPAHMLLFKLKPKKDACLQTASSESSRMKLSSSYESHKKITRSIYDI